MEPHRERREIPSSHPKSDGTKNDENPTNTANNEWRPKRKIEGDGHHWHSVYFEKKMGWPRNKEVWQQMDQQNNGVETLGTQDREEDLKLDGAILCWSYMEEPGRESRNAEVNGEDATCAVGEPTAEIRSSSNLVSKYKTNYLIRIM